MPPTGFYRTKQIARKRQCFPNFSGSYPWHLTYKCVTSYTGAFALLCCTSVANLSIFGLFSIPLVTLSFCRTEGSISPSIMRPRKVLLLACTFSEAGSGLEPVLGISHKERSFSLERCWVTPEVWCSTERWCRMNFVREVTLITGSLAICYLRIPSG